ncbi:MAG TPA: SAM-dependent methyltransferase [Puia sp.]|nr:SAM-dependent methyltransferase [Puia sp.]
MLSDIIKQKIQQEGPLSFHDFMEMALYYPQSGYYTSPPEKIGTNGDFYTSSSLTSAFGAMIGRQLEQLWGLLGGGPFTIVEYGAGTGQLCQDILDYLQANRRLYDQLRYCIIEKSPSLREQQKKRLPDKVSWPDSIRDLAPLTGCVLSNELVDNFSVHQVVMGGELMEVYVDHGEDFTERLAPASPALKEYLAELRVELPEGYRAEINLEAIRWIEEIAASLQKGYVITIDYGYLSSGLYTGSRSRGTLLCYHQHTINDSPYQHIGQQDITAHVNFSALCHWGLKSGLACCGLTNQAQFLLALGIKEYFRKTEAKGQDVLALAKKEAQLTHLLLVDMGMKYKVLIQRKGRVPQDLLGLRL